MATVVAVGAQLVGSFVLCSDHLALPHLRIDVLAGVVQVAVCGTVLIDGHLLGTVIVGCG